MAIIGSSANLGGGLGSRSKDGKKKLRPGMADFVAGEAGEFQANLFPFLPQELIGGTIPHIPGTEEDAVWNAAAQACGTERVHYTYAVDGGRVWYLACPSAALASNPDSWCPLAAALPGKSEHWDKETVYLYEQEGVASALRWDPETGRMQVFLGAARTILPRVQSMDANFVTINTEAAQVVPWHNRTMRTEKLSRATVRVLILSGLLVNLLAVCILMVNIVGIGYQSSNLETIKQQTDAAALDLMKNAANVMQSDTIRHMVRVQDLLDTLSVSNGYLVRYEVQDKRTTWEAILPQAYVTDVLSKNSGAEVAKREEGDLVRIKGPR
jgi:hypothetical protein